METGPPVRTSGIVSRSALLKPLLPALTLLS